MRTDLPAHPPGHIRALSSREYSFYQISEQKKKTLSLSAHAHADLGFAARICSVGYFWLTQQMI